MDAVELAIQQEITAAFVEADPQLLDIYRPTKVDDDAGGSLPDPAPDLVYSGAMRLIPQSEYLSRGQQTFNGQVSDPAFAILSPIPFEFHKGDFFEWHDGETYVIGGVPDHPTYENKAPCRRRKIG